MIEEGIYLEEKKGTVGVAGTSKPIVYRNLWATAKINEDRVILQLLDDKANPTGIIEEVSLGELNCRFTHKPVKPQIWEELKKKLLTGRSAAPLPKPKPQSSSVPKKETPAGNSPKKETPGGNSKSWWQT